TVTNKAFAEYNKDLLMQDTGGNWEYKNATVGTQTVANGLKFKIDPDTSKIVVDASALHDALQSLAAGEKFTDIIQYTIKMANGTLSVGTLNIVIEGKNDAANIGGNDSGTANEDGAAATGQLTVSDADHDQNSFTVASGTTAKGAWSIDAGGN